MNASRLLLAAEMTGAAGLATISTLYKPLNAVVMAYIWDPATTYYLLALLVLCERVAVGVRDNTPWRPVAREIGLMLAGYTVLLFFLHGFSKAEPTTMIWLRIFLLPFVLFHLRSLAKALGKLRMLNRESSELLDVQLGRRLDEVRNPSPPSFPPTV